MIRFLSFLLALILTIGLTWTLNHSFIAGGKPIPAIGKLIDPFHGFWQNADPAIPIPYPSVTAHLKGKAKVVYDDRMVPHIFADSILDAIFLQGYITAKDRLFQMDFATRAISGRLSEILGPSVLGSDQLMRRRGMVFAAENALIGWKKDPKNWSYLEAYAAGVNAYIHTLQPKNYPFEFKFFDYAPEDWTPLKSALFARSMALSLNSHETDLETTNALALLGQKNFDFLYPESYPEESPVIPEGTPWNFTPTPLKTPANPKLGMIPFKATPKEDPDNGSNNWAVAPGKTKNGHPILCGDPHLTLRLPSIWYEMQLHTDGLNAYGASLPGVPGIIIGFNEDIAWTETNVGQDVLDWYTIHWKDAQKKEYLLDGKFVKADLKIEEYKVKGSKETIRDTVRYTYWGPVVYESDTSGRHDMAMRWLTHDVPPSDEMRVFIDLNKAHNYDEYAKALENWTVPAQNFAFACKNGDIALKVQGKFPLKAREQGRFVQDGSNTANAWQGFIPESQNPKVKNPARGFISSANQRSASTSYPYYYSGAGFEPYRGRYLNRQLARMDSITVDDMKKLQFDTYGMNAEESLPLMIKHLDTTSLNNAEKVLLSTLHKWDYRFDKDQLGSVLYQVWFDSLYHDTWDEILQKKNAAEILLPTEIRTTFLLRDDPGNIFFDNPSTPARETANEICTAAFHQMAGTVAQMMLTSPLLNWGGYKDAFIGHLTKLEPLSRMHLQLGGHARALNAVKKNHGPSWRMVVELADPVKAWVVFPGGESGNPGSPYYDNFVDTWAKGEYYEALFLKQADEKNPRIRFVQEFK